MPSTPTYRSAFISHAHADNARCASIAAHLRARGVDVWIDLNNAQVAHDLSDEINDQLGRRTAFVLMVTANSNASHWVRLERGAYISLASTPATRYVNGVERLIVSVRLSDEVPFILRGLLWIDAIGKTDAQVADEIAAALIIRPGDAFGVTPSAQPSVAPSLPAQAQRNDWDEIGIHARLYDLGFRGWRVRRTDVEFILPPTRDVAAGSFLMGSADSDGQAYDDEKPQYRIPVGAFAIGTFPVTVAEYALYLKANPGVAVPPTFTYPKDVNWAPKALWETSVSWDTQRQQRADHPVVCVSWFNARDYAIWLAKTTSQTWRLPTEAEWEKAARWDVARQVSRIYPWGDTFDKTCANTRPNDTEPGLGRTTPVGSYPTGKSPYDAQDMAGNVWEWCSSLYKEQYPYDAVASEILDNSTDVRVCRGGAWGGSPWLARAADRGGDLPGYGSYNLGFRVARGGAAGTT